LTQGREPRLPRTLYDEANAGTGKAVQTPEENAAKLKIFEIVRRNLETAAQDQARHYNLRRRPWKPKVREKVWMREHPLSKAAEGFAAKLAPKFGGPYKVVAQKSPVIFELRGSDGKATRTAHVSGLKTAQGVGEHDSRDTAAAVIRTPR
ncbi:hypothetical protein KR018_008026, partial [Drosophila ironensis]